MSRPVWQTIAGRLARIFGIRFYDMYLAHRNLSPSAEPSARPRPCEVRLATDQDLETIASLLGGETRDDFDRYKSIGSRCYVADQDSKIAGCLWVNHHVVELKGMRLAKVPAGHTFTHGAFVLPEFRGQRMYRYLRDAVCGELYKSGFGSVACLVDKANHLSIRVLQQEGMEFYSANILKLPVIGPILFCRALA
jgi:hypothetical protein